MTTKNKLLVAGSAVLAFVLLTGFRGGHFGGGHFGGPRDPERVKQMISWRLDDRLEELNATEDQKQAIHGLKDSLFEDGKRLFEENKGARTQMLDQWESANPDSRAVHSMVDARVDAFRAFAHKVADAALEAHRILTPEQRQQVTGHVREHMNAR
ncbi:Spy/CpxP family protein refolding chaperone [Archangium lansingense]|uniref:Spy/CpxP family protein refolding chaperone n=1 Tax=Archangium lansingense TaxID=2995310 RepID=A0ABT4AHR6_9BACT|nr:Spy/CpxP family protein refolding chaperone [Archangium lansinium]MCY1081222.1 Spy/CpxP family protein refolding chaperone [Archangium lansinium]